MNGRHLPAPVADRELKGKRVRRILWGLQDGHVPIHPRMKTLNHPALAQTRLPFRILAGILSAVFLLGTFPLTLLEAGRGDWMMCGFALCSLWTGIGLGCGALTGRWPGAR